MAKELCIYYNKNIVKSEWYNYKINYARWQRKEENQNGFWKLIQYG